ncbi:MAG: PilZ domain-containing protein [Candidatus Omnitrophica bacterium]|nr:PilZ domain-containing protein [Candidatus Omnitrophota bacterium]
MQKKQQHSATAERRKGVRVNKSLTVALCPSKYLLRTNALSRDISEDGICLVSPYRFEIGKTIELGIYLPGFEKPAVTVGEVVRRNETDDPKFPYLLGIKFIQIDPKIKEQILEHMRFYMVQN